MRPLDRTSAETASVPPAHRVSEYIGGNRWMEMTTSIKLNRVQDVHSSFRHRTSDEGDSLRFHCGDVLLPRCPRQSTGLQHVILDRILPAEKI